MSIFFDGQNRQPRIIRTKAETPVFRAEPEELLTRQVDIVINDNSKAKNTDGMVDVSTSDVQEGTGKIQGISGPNESSEVATGNFSSYVELANYLHDTGKADFEAIYGAGTHRGGCQAASNVANSHKNDWSTVTKQDILKELYEEYCRLDKEEEESNANKFASFSDLRNYVFSGARNDYNALYGENSFQSGCTAAQNVVDAHIGDWSSVTREQILKELHDEYIHTDALNKKFNSYEELKGYLSSQELKDELNKEYNGIEFEASVFEKVAEMHKEDFASVSKKQIINEIYKENYIYILGNSTFNSWEEMRSYAMSCYADFSHLYTSIRFQGGSDAAREICNQHKEDWATITKKDIVDWLAEAFQKHVFETWDDLYTYAMSSCYNDYRAKYPEATFSGGWDIGKEVANRHKNDYNNVSKTQIIDELYAAVVARNHKIEEFNRTVNEVGFFKSYSSMQNYLMGGAEEDYNRLYKDIKYQGGTTAAQNVSNFHINDWATVTKAQLLEELHAQLRLANSNDVKYNSSSNYIIEYLCRDAKIDFETKYPGVKFRGVCQAAIDLCQKPPFKYYSFASIVIEKDTILEALYQAYQQSPDNKSFQLTYIENDAGYWSCKKAGKTNGTYYTSYQEMVEDVTSRRVLNSLKNDLGIENFVKWGDSENLINLVLEMHRHDYQTMNFSKFMSDILNIYYQGITSFSEVTEFNNKEAINENPLKYYNDALNSLMYSLQKAETANDYYNIAAQLSMLPVFEDTNISEYAKKYGVSEESLRAFFNNPSSKALFQKAQYILAECKVHIRASSEISGYGTSSEKMLSACGIKVVNGNIVYVDDLLALNNGSDGGVNNVYTYQYLQSVLEMIAQRLEYLTEYLQKCATSQHLQKEAQSTQGEIGALFEIYTSISSMLQKYDDTAELISEYDDEELQGLLSYDSDINAVTKYIDDKYGHFIGNKDEFMNLVASFYEGASNYSYEDCAKFLLQILATYEDGEIPDKKEIAEFLARTLKMQDKDYENYKSLYETLEGTIAQYLEENENISIDDFIRFCKENNVFANFRTQAEIEKDYCDTLDRLNELLQEQIAIINKYNGYEPPKGSEDAIRLAEIKQQIEDNQYLLNKYSAETSHENAEETFKQYFVKIISGISDTGKSPEEIEQLLREGTNTSVLFEDTEQTRTSRRASANNIGAMARKYAAKIHNFMSNVTEAIGITREVSKDIGFTRGSDALDKYNDYCKYGDSLINSYNDPQEACSTIISWMGVSTSFVSGVFAYANGDTESAMKDVMVGFSYAMSPVLGGTIQNLVNIVKTLNKYKENPQEYGKDWAEVFGSSNPEKVAKAKLIFDISLNVLSGVGNFLTFGLFGLASTGLKTVQTLLTASLGKVMQTVDKWTEKLFGKPLSTLMENFWQHSGLKKFWKKSGLQKLCKLLGLTSIWNKIFKKDKSDNKISESGIYDNDDVLYQLMQQLLESPMNEEEVQQWLNNYTYDYNENAEDLVVNGKHTEYTIYYDGETVTIRDVYTNNRKDPTGRIITHEDGSKEYYEVNENGKMVLVAKKDKEGNLTYVNDSPSEENAQGTGGMGAASNPNTPSNKGTMTFEEAYNTAITWLTNIGLGNLAVDCPLTRALASWIAGGCQGNFSWTAGGSNSGGGNGNGNGGGGSDWNGMDKNGNWYPDGSGWNPIGGNGWGIGDSFIGVGGHGGSPVLGGGGGGGGGYNR